MANLNDNDFESPGYEHLRSYQNMNNLYYKLVALNYRRDFCPLYKCPPIHKYYFSLPSKNTSEQQFLFNCLCAWLIKDKCLMNLEIQPEEYGESDSTIMTILEAIRLLVTPNEESTKKVDPKKVVGFASNRLKRGYGPEVIWTVSILADRALEMMIDSKSYSSKFKVIHHDKSSHSDQEIGSSITIGQPFVGGGLTTRPLGSYRLDDANLLFDDGDKQSKITLNPSTLNNVNADEWYQQVERGKSALLITGGTSSETITHNWQEHRQSIIKAIHEIDEFVSSSKPLLEVISGRIGRQLQVLNGREKFIQKNLSEHIKRFVEIWRDYSVEKKKQKSLMSSVTAKTDMFENYNDQLENLGVQIESRIKDLNDGSKMDELKQLTRRLKKECDDLDIKVGLLLSVYFRRQAEIVFATKDKN